MDALIPTLQVRAPALAKRFVRRPLGTLPSPCTPLPVPAGSGLTGLWVKREDCIAPGLAGNKVRTLEMLCGRERRALLGFGPAGSNWANALLAAGTAAGLPVDLVLWSGFTNPAGAGALAAGRTQARHWTEGSAWRAVWGALCGLARRPRPRWLLPGGASTAGVLANAAAALECCEQCAATGSAPPDRVYVPWGSGTTVAGVAVGFALAAAHTEVVAVRIAARVLANGATLRWLVRRGRRALARAGVHVAAPRLRADHRFAGPRYGQPTPAGLAAARWAVDAAGLRLESTYVAKACAALLADAQAGQLRGRSAAWWCTILEAPCAS